jgi:amidase
LSFATPFGVPGRVDPQVRRAVRRIAETLAGLGHEVFPADPNYGLVGLSFVPRATNGIAAWLDRLPAGVVVEKRTRTHARLGRLLGGPALRAARAAEPALRHRVGRIFERADVVLTPTTAQLPMRIGGTDPDRFGQTTRAIEAACPFAWAWNVLGWPGLSVPAGLSTGGLPIGAQLLGPANSEGLLLALGAQLEAAERWYDVRPPAAAAPTV